MSSNTSRGGAASPSEMTTVELLEDTCRGLSVIPGFKANEIALRDRAERLKGALAVAESFPGYILSALRAINAPAPPIQEGDPR